MIENEEAMRLEGFVVLVDCVVWCRIENVKVK